MTRADAPGRVNLIGEHTDHSEGLVLPVAIAQRTTVECASRADRHVALASDGFPDVAFDLGAEVRTGDWGDHVRGVTWALDGAGFAVGGFDARVRSLVPAGAGLGSSAALEVAMLRALRGTFGLAIDDTALALLAHRAESDFVGARVGIMDHLAASLGRESEALLIDTRTLVSERVALPPGLGLVVIDSSQRHEHASDAYNARRAECEAAARALGLRSLRDATDEDVAALARRDPLLARRARHVVRENSRVAAFVHALRAGDLATCGDLVDASHRSLRDDFEVSTPLLDALAECLRGEPGVYGARLVGGGFGGSVLALADRERAAAAARHAAAVQRAQWAANVRVLLPA